MKNCFKAILIPAAVAALFAAVTFTGCTEVDDTVGQGLIPDDQHLVLHSATLDGIDSYMADASDSIPVSRQNRLMIGRMQSEFSGKISSGTVFQMAPARRENEDEEAIDLGNDPYQHTGWITQKLLDGTQEKIKVDRRPHADSAMLRLEIKSVAGDNTKEQKFYVYRMVTDEVDALDFVKVYYGYDPWRHIDRNAPLFSFTLKDEQPGVAIKKLDLEPAGEMFLRELVDLDTTIYMVNEATGVKDIDRKFRKIFNGFYVAPSEDLAEAPEDAAIYDIELTYVDANGVAADVSSLTVFAHNHLDPREDTEGVPHTHDGPGWDAGEGLFTNEILTVVYTMNDLDASSRFPNTSIICFDRDPAGSIVETLPFINPDPDPESFEPDPAQRVDPVYVQGLTGVGGYLDFGERFIQQLEALKTENGKEYGMMINKAVLYVWFEDETDIEVLDNAPGRLGMYYFKTGKNTSSGDEKDGNLPRPIPDYSYSTELSVGGVLPYGGFLNRAKGYYEMDISTYVRQLASDPGKARTQVYIAPDVHNRLQPRQVALINPWDESLTTPERWNKRIQVKIYYSLVSK